MDRQQRELEAPLGELAELEYAAELLEVTSEAELESLMRRIGGVYRRTPALQKVMSVAKQLVPVAGGLLLPDAFPPDVQDGITRGVSHGLDVIERKLLGAELEGMSPEDRELELARRWVRFTRAALQDAAVPGRDPRAALVQAARTTAPALLGSPALAGHRPRRTPQAGRWQRRGTTLVVHLD